MAVVRPFRALRYDPAVAGRLESLVAPPYDVIGAEQREQLRGRNAYNVVHLTLPDSEDEAAASLADLRERGILVREDKPACWWLEQEYVGPDGIAEQRGYPRPVGMSSAARDEDVARRLWEVSEDLTGVRFPSTM